MEEKKESIQDNFQVQLEFEKSFFCEIPVKLTPKQEKFCQEYIKCGNASKAYKTAFDCNKMKEKSLWECASRLKNNNKIEARLRQLHEKMVNNAVMSGIEVLKQLSNIAKMDTYDKMGEKIRALELLGKHHGLFKDKVDIESNQPLVNKITVKFVGNEIKTEKNKDTANEEI